VTTQSRVKHPLLTSKSPNPSGEPTNEPTTIMKGSSSKRAKVALNDRIGVEKEQQAINPQTPQAKSASTIQYVRRYNM
jgi:hypothetical protein